MKLSLAVPLLVLMTVARAHAQSDSGLLRLLPVETQNSIAEAREFCDQAGVRKASPDQGLEQIDLNGDGSRDILVDWQNVACGAPGGGGCSNRGCNLDLYKQTKSGTMKLVFSEHLQKYFVSTDYAGKFRLLAVTVQGGNEKCPAEASESEPASHLYCDALVYWQQGAWRWQPIK